VSDQANSNNSRFSAFWQSTGGKKTKGALWGALLSAGIGYLLVWSSLGEGLVNKSYDLPFQYKKVVTQTNILMVYLDDESHARLHQKYLVPWNRAFYTALVKRATAEKARAVVFDVVFSDSLDKKTDQEFADAMLENGNVIIADDLVATPVGLAGQFTLDFTPIDPVINGGAAALANDSLYPGADDAVRCYVPADGRKDRITRQVIDSEAWAAMFILDQSIKDKYGKTKSELHWLNYYGPEIKGLQSVSLYRALTNNDPDLPPGFFKDKVIFVGEKLETKAADTRKDEYPSPFSHLPDNKFFTGVGIHATAFLNILQDDWLRRLPTTYERLLIISIGVLAGAGLIFFRPIIAAGLALFAVFPIALGNFYFFTHQKYWFPWLIPVAAQIPVGLIWSVTFNSIQLYVEKQKVEQSLSLYLPARLVKKFANDPELLKPGAKTQQLTTLFSDIASFTSITEGMNPNELANMMNAYFQSAVDECIHYTEGTIVKYIGDAIFAFWNAPDPQEDHPIRAAEAALRFRDQDTHEFNGKKIITRIGLHTGEANVGNFGSTTRVDYTAFGENINLTSRMEGLNKYLGTRVLMTGDTKQGIADRFVTRYIGLFRLKGFEKAVQVYELMDRPPDAEKTRELRERFEEARALFVNKDFTGARAAFLRVLELNPTDGPSYFYMAHIQEMHIEELPANWKGDITLKEK
jgi:adenylate cyclase